MNRHYGHTNLKNPNPYQRLGAPRISSVWKLSPNEVAQYSGDLVRVMTEAAEKYIYERSLAEIKQEFQHQLTQDQKPTQNQNPS